MQRTRNDIADQKETENILPRAAASEDRAEPGEEKPEACNLGPPPPAAAPEFLGLEGSLGEVAVRVDVQIEAGEREDDVEELMLHRDEEFASEVEGHLPLVVRGPE